MTIAPQQEPSRVAVRVQFVCPVESCEALSDDVVSIAVQAA